MSISHCLFQMGDASLSESPEEEDNDSPGPQRGNRTPPDVLQDHLSQSTDNSLKSPRKRTQTLPAFNCPLTGMAAKTDAVNRWSRLQEGAAEKSGTLSEDIFKILDLRSSGSYFGKSPLSIKEEEPRSMAGKGNDSTGSSTAGTQKTDSDSRPAEVPVPLKSTEILAVSPQANSKSEHTKHSRQSVDR